MAGIPGRGNKWMDMGSILRPGVHRRTEREDVTGHGRRAAGCLHQDVGGGDLQAAPTVLAQRVQTKYRWEPPPPPAAAAAGGGKERQEAQAVPEVRTIEAIELAVLASGFGDPAGALPLLVVKSRLTFEKEQ